MTRVLNLQWGFGVGGIATFNALLPSIEAYGVELQTLVIQPRWKATDSVLLAETHASSHSIDSIFDLSWLKVVKEALDEADVVLTHGVNAHFAVAFVSAIFRLKPIRRIAVYHGEYYGPNVLKRFLARFLNAFAHYYLRRWCHKVIAVSRFSAERLRSFRLGAEKIEVIHNALRSTDGPVAQSASVRADLGVPVEAFMVVFIGRIDRIKGVDLLIQAFVDWKSEDAVLVLVGDGPERRNLERNASARGGTQIIFAGVRKDVDAVLQAADLFVLPSRAENHSLTVLEAMRAAKPIVLSRVGGNTESVDDSVHGIVVQPESVDDLVAAFRTIRSEPEEAMKMGARARARFEEDFGLQRWAKKMSRALQVS